MVVTPAEFSALVFEALQVYLAAVILPLGYLAMGFGLGEAILMVLARAFSIVGPKMRVFFTNWTHR